MVGRTTVDTPLIGWELVLNDGMMVRSWSFRSPVPWLTRSVADSTSTGTADAVALRGCAREPTTTVSSVKPASSRSISAGDNPRASTSSGVIPSTRLSSSTRASVRLSTCSCGSVSRGSAPAADRKVVHAGTSTASIRVARHGTPSACVVSASISRMSSFRFEPATDLYSKRTASVAIKIDSSPRARTVICEANGGYGERVDDPARLPAALARALDVIAR